MGRPHRIHFPGAVHHIMHRGNYRQEIFHRDLDRRRYLALLGRCIQKHDARLFAYCLMSNHVHLVLQVAGIEASRIMLVLGSSYARYVNARLGKIGHLFQNRYRSVLVEDDPQLLQTIRYVVLNPVRAGLVASPEEYRWSSHLDYLGRRSCGFLDTGPILSLFAATVGRARTAYARFVLQEQPSGNEAPQTPEMPPCWEPPPPLPIPPVTDWDTILRVVSESYGCTPAELLAPGKDHDRSEGRTVAAHLAIRCRARTLTEVAMIYGRSLAVVSRSVARLRDPTLRDPALADRIARIKDRIEKAKMLSLTPTS